MNSQHRQQQQMIDILLNWSVKKRFQIDVTFNHRPSAMSQSTLMRIGDDDRKTIS
jgi:hypothetical protein